MSVKDKLKLDSNNALKIGDSKRVGVLRYLISLIDKRSLQLPPEEMTEVEELAVLRKELKNKQEAREIFLKAARNDLVEEQDFEIEVVKKYLPQEMDEEEIRKIADEAVVQFGNNFGLVMREVIKKVAGRAGGEVVSRIVKEKLETLR